MSFYFMNLLRSEEESFDFFTSVFLAEQNPETVEKILIDLYTKKENADQITGAAKAMLEHATIINPKHETFDVCGTGGSGAKKAFNVSTAVAFVLAAAQVYTAKHGNKAVSSQSGSADVLQHLHIPTLQSQESVEESLQKNHLAFLFAPVFHPKMQNIMPIRKKIPHRTIFNLLGPLTNPCTPQRQIVGVSDKDLLLPMIQSLRSLKKQKAMVLWGEDGLDEATIRAHTHYMKLDEMGNITEGSFFPEQFGIRSVDKNFIFSEGSPNANAKIIIDTFTHASSGPHMDMILLNAGIGLFISGKTGSIEEGLALAEKLIMSKAVINTLSSMQA